MGDMDMITWRRQMAGILAELPEFMLPGWTVERNMVGNLSIRSADGEWIGYIDVLRPETSQLPHVVGGAR